MSAQDNPTDQVDTSTEEESLDPESRLEESEFSFESEAETETQTEEETEETEELSDETEATESEDDTEEESGEDAGEDKQPSEADQKRHNDEMAKRRIAEREAKEKAKKDAQNEYLQGAKTPEEMALRQLQIQAYNTNITTNSSILQNGIDKAVAHIDLLKNGTPAQQETLANALDDFERMYVSRDRNGDPVEVRGDVFQFLQAKADEIRKLTGEGARQQAKAKDGVRARTMTKPSRKPQEQRVDEGLRAFREEAERY